MMTKATVVDARGHRCPVPTLRLRKALEAAPSGGRVLLLADDPMARIDVPHFIEQVGAEILEREEIDGGFSFLVAKPRALRA
jgi:tRNA 2-thiouridine synthesizing protein A